MSDMTEELKRLRRRLPAVPTVPKVDDDGDEFWLGFEGNISGSEKFVTDGHLCLLASEINVTVRIYPCLDAIGLITPPSEASILSCWNPIEMRNEKPAYYIGCALYEDYEVFRALMRDEIGRVMVVDAHILAFCIKAVHPDSFAVSEHTNKDGIFDQPLSLRREGKLVGIIMGVRLSGDYFKNYDLTCSAIKL